MVEHFPQTQLAKAFQESLMLSAFSILLLIDKFSSYYRNAIKMSTANKDKIKIRSLNLFPVVGIGASAGGLEAFKKLLKAIPENSGMAYFWHSTWIRLTKAF
jgi:chemotaxis response regulator CheB